MQTPHRKLWAGWFIWTHKLLALRQHPSVSPQFRVFGLNMRRAHHRKNDKHRLLFLSFLSFFLLSPKFKRAAGFCRLGSYTGHNTRPSSYSPSCPSLTKQSPSVTSSSDRRRPLGLCQDWVMCECWTGIREKNNTLHTEGQRSEGLKLPSFLFVC